jgi:hypothetical protein
MGINRRRFLARTAGVAGAALVGQRAGLAADIAAAALPQRDPSIVGSWGGLVIPSQGAYFGADDTVRGFTTATGIETQLRRRMAIRNRRYGWLAQCPSPAAVADAALTGPPVVVMCSFGQPSTFPVKTTGWKGKGDLATTAYGQGIDRITNGEFDRYWTGVATGLRALPSPVIFRLWQEPNGAHNPYYAQWQGGIGTGGEAAYIAAWRHVKAVFAAAGATIQTGGNCIFVFCAQRRSTVGTWEVYYPGDDVVDWVATDLYRDTLSHAAQNDAADWDTYNFAVAHRKPYIISEGGFVQGQTVWNPGGALDKDGSRTGRSLILNTYQAIMQNPQCVAYCVWNAIGPNGDNFIDTSAASLAQYRTWANDAFYALTR